jgi:hypothetical protein
VPQDWRKGATHPNSKCPPNGRGSCQHGRVEERPLTAGSGANRGQVARRRDVVLRPWAPHTPAVHALLLHLREQGFEGAPEVVGIEGDREVLRYIPGDVPIPPEPPEGGWPVVSMSQLISVARLLRDFHAASATFEPPAGTIWQGGAASPFEGTLVCHNDPVPGNVVFRDGTAIALLDFDYAGLSDPIWDVAIAAQHWVPLADPVDFVGEERDGWNAAERLVAYCDTYRLPRPQLSRLLDAVATYLERGRRGVERRVETGEQAFVDYWKAGLADRLIRAGEWVREHRDSLIH